jgi:flagellar basal-body rod protein FlgF
MERLIHTAVSGAELAQTALRITANNLANVNTVGFKADMEQATALQVTGEGFRTRFQAQLQPVATDLSAGAVMETGRDLDLAVSAEGLIAVADADGNEAYTRAGELQVGADGRLTVHGYAVQGLGGEIQLPEFGDIDISADGTLNLLPVGGGVIEQDERIKLVSARDVVLVKGDDGLLRAKDGNPLEQDPAVTVRSGVLEGSNVNAVEEMVSTLNISRQFELNLKMMKTADELAVSGNKLISG